MTVELATDVYPEVKSTIVAAIKALNLRDLSGGVYSQISTDPANLQFPCVIVTIEGENEKPDGGDTIWKNAIYPVRVLICDRMEPALRHDREPQYLEWRKKIIDAFDKTRILSTQYKPCTVDRRPVFQPDMRAFQHMVSGLIVNTPVAELRKKGSNG